MTTHPVAELFPMLSASELAEMVESIQKEGLFNPCVRQGGMLLDGRNRMAACKIAGVEPSFIEYTGSSPVAFIIAVNLARRHLDKGQKIAMALEIEPHFAEEAKKRMVAGGGDKKSDGAKSGMGHCPIPDHKPAVARDQAAAAVGVSGKLVSAAKAIREADPELFEKVKQGKMSIARAKKAIKAREM